MTRAYALLASLILIASPMAGCLTGEDIEDIEEIIDDILGCMDENAENYAENATAELLGDCIYLASMEIFITAMTEQMEIDEMLEIIPRAGYSMSITMSEWNTDANMQMDTVIEEMVMADLDTDSVYVKNSISIVPFMTYEFTQIQVGELVNVHYTLGGMMAGEGAGMGSYQTRDADPDVMDVISSLVSVSDAGDTGEEVGLDLPTGDVSDLFSEMPADTEPVITYEDETGVQTMTLEYTNDTGHDTSIVILIDENEELMSYHISTDNGSATSSISYTVMWGDAVVIEVDDTLPRTSIPINFHVQGMPEDDGGDDTFYCDNGNEIPMDSVDDGWDDCGDGSDESDDGDDVFVCDNGEEIPAEWENDGGEDCSDGSDENYVHWIDYEGGYCEWNTNDTGWWCKYSEEDEDWDTWWYYCENHDSDWHCTDDFGQSEDYEHSADGTEWSGSGDNDGPPTPEEAMQMTDTDGDGYASYQEIQDMWESEPSNPELDWDEVTILFDDCDYDGNDLIDIDEMQCFIDGIVDMLPDDGDDPDPEQMMDYMDTDDDGYLSLQELFDYLNGEREQNGEPPMTSEDEDAYAAWFYSGDADGDDLLSLDEFAQLLDSTGDDDGEEPPTAENFVDWFDTDGDGVLTLDEIIDGIRNTNNVSGELPPSAEDEAYMEAAFNDADENADGVLDLDELGHFIYVIDGDGDGDDGDDEPFHVTMMVIDQTLNAPISDFEVRFLVDCGEPDEEGNEPPISDCTVVASNGLTEGFATVDPEITEYEFTYQYLDLDGDGLISDMDTLVIDNLMPDVRVELYDTWADQYTSESFATAEVLPGFGALMAVVVLLGAALATRRD
jgi:low density lipoprotein-related protein 2